MTADFAEYAYPFRLLPSSESPKKLTYDPEYETLETSTIPTEYPFSLLPYGGITLRLFVRASTKTDGKDYFGCKR